MDARTELVIALISGQDVRKWDVTALVQWAQAVAAKILEAQ